MCVQVYLEFDALAQRRIQHMASLSGWVFENRLYYMTVSHKNLELPNLRVRLAEIDIDRDPDSNSNGKSIMID